MITNNITIKTREKIMNTIREHSLIEKNQHIVIGLSGGPDSVCLFFVLNQLAMEINLKLYPVHINHKFRPGDAEKDQAFVEKLSKENGWQCTTFVFDCESIAEKEKITSEEAGRKVRYESFAKVAEEIVLSGVPRESVRIAVAQNADDQVETILFRILRGVGTDGLSGIAYKRLDESDNVIIRPLLDVSKEEVLAFCKAENLTPCIDKTNLQPIYARNKIRLNLIPYLEKEYNINIKETIRRMGKIAAIDKEALWQEGKKAYYNILISEKGDEILLEGDKLRELSQAIRQRVISLGLKKIGLGDDVAFVHYQAMEDIIFGENPSSSVNLPKGYKVLREYADLKLTAPYEGGRAPLFKVSEITIRDYGKMTLEKDKYCAFDLESLRQEFGEDVAGKLSIRTRMPGDFIAIAAGKTKKIQDYFIDEKVPKAMRDRCYLLAINHEALWILPNSYKSRYSINYKLGNSTKNVILVELL